MKRTPGKRTRGRRGASTLEFGLSFLIFLAAMYGVLEFGRIVASYNILSGATREGARYAIVHGSASSSAASSSDIQNVVRNWSIGLDTSAVTVTTTWSSGNAPGDPVKVTSTYTVTPFTGLILSQGIPLTSTSQMVISQ